MIEKMDDTTISIKADEIAQLIEPKPKSQLLVGNMTIYNTKHFNWLNRIMFKIFFGIKITNIRGE